jgi:interferon-induced GTP-binding protein Mx
MQMYFTHQLISHLITSVRASTHAGHTTLVQVAAVLQNKRKPLRLGYAMVRNRTQRELAAGVTLQQAHAAEQRFFAEHPVFGQLTKSESLFGIEALTKRCVGLLVTRIKSALPNMKWELQQSLLQVCAVQLLFC